VLLIQLQLEVHAPVMQQCCDSVVFPKCDNVTSKEGKFIKDALFLFISESFRNTSQALVFSYPLFNVYASSVPFY